MKISMSKVSMDIVSQTDLEHALRIIGELQEEAKPKDIETNVQLTADELQAVSAPLMEEDSVVYDDQIPEVVSPVDEVEEKKPAKKASKPRKSKQSASAKAGFSVFGGGLDTKKPAKPNPADSKAAFASDPLDDPVEKVQQPVDDIPFEAQHHENAWDGEEYHEKDEEIEHIDLSEPEEATPPPVDIDRPTFLAKVRDALTHASKAEVGDVIEGIAGHRSTRDIHEDHWAEIIVELDRMLTKKVAG
jgi:hypothetical protein